MKKFLALILASLVSFTLASPPAAALPETTEITIHYHRFDGDYKDWNLWLWPKGGDGASYAFTEDDSFGKVAKVKVPGTAKVDEIGLIVRLAEWSSKDVAEDRYIKSFKDGKAEIWLIQSDATIYDSRPAITTKLTASTAKSFKSFEVSLNRSAAISSIASGISVTSDAKPLAIASVVGVPTGATNSNRVLVTLDSAFALGGSLAISHPEFGTVNPDLGGLYASQEFEDAFHYPGSDLGFVYSPTSTSFRVWAPTATAAELLVYSSDAEKTAGKIVPMTKAEKGTWTASLPGDQHLTI